MALFSLWLELQVLTESLSEELDVWCRPDSALQPRDASVRELVTPDLEDLDQRGCRGRRVVKGEAVPDRGAQRGRDAQPGGLQRPTHVPLCAPRPCGLLPGARLHEHGVARSCIAICQSMGLLQLLPGMSTQHAWHGQLDASALCTSHSRCAWFICC